jgi:phosphatidylglycerol:prolipoprotein diacylglycerol transferase
LRKRPFKPGFFVALFALMYAPARFLFDFLRNTDLQNADVRWAGLTPAQWGMIVFFLLASALMVRLSRRAEPRVRPAYGASAPEAPSPPTPPDPQAPGQG